jgi:hypothetical protein
MRTRVMPAFAAYRAAMAADIAIIKTLAETNPNFARKIRSARENPSSENRLA